MKSTVDRIRELVGASFWARWGRQWIRAVQEHPEYFERLVSDCEQQGSHLKNPGAWMHRNAKTEGFWPCAEEEAR